MVAPSPNWTDVFTAIGTVVTGVVALAALGVTIWFARKDRNDRKHDAERQVAISLIPLLEQIKQGAAALGPDQSQLFDKTNFPALLARDEISLLVVQIKDKKVTSRLLTLCDLIDTVAYGALAAEDPASTLTKRGRIDSDFQRYLQYVRGTVEAFISGERVPPDAKPLFLQRDSMEPWLAPGME